MDAFADPEQRQIRGIFMNDNRMVNYGLFMAFLSSLSLTIPLIVIGVPFGVISVVSLVVFLPYIIPSDWTAIAVIALYTLILRPGLYIWALVVAISGQQDIVAIAFYVIAGLQSVSIIKNFIAYILTFIFSMRG
jgi:hypothetical protein